MIENLFEASFFFSNCLIDKILYIDIQKFIFQDTIWADLKYTNKNLKKFSCKVVYTNLYCYSSQNII